MTQTVAVIYLLDNDGYFKYTKDKVENDVIYSLAAFFGIHFYNLSPGWVPFLGSEIELILRNKIWISVVNPIA